MTLRDPIADGLASGWKVTRGSQLERDLALDADVAIIGSGAGGGVTADILSAAGLDVVLIEEGPLRSSRDFRMLEAEAYPQLYHESAARKTHDKAITILQGRCVGGSTTVNWTSSFRTPEATLRFWNERLGLPELAPQAMQPWFDRMEAALGVAPWAVPPNENNDLLRRGATRLGIGTGSIRRNVRDCWNLGYCGMGCPTNAKQSMLVTTIPAALGRGARLLAEVRVERLAVRGGRVEAVQGLAMDARGVAPSGRRVTVRARHVVLAAGAIGSPAILIRSAVPDPHRRLGTRTFLHPTVISAALMPERVDGHAGAPQTIYSDHFLERDPIDGPIGFKLEAPPLHPLLVGMTMQGFGQPHAELMQSFPHMHVLLALLRDGFHPESTGGNVAVRSDGSPVLAYALPPAFWDAVRRAFLAMAEIQFAAGAKQVTPVHEAAGRYDSWAAARAAIAALPLEPLATRVVSAHVMGGCGMGDAPRRGVVDVRGRHFQVENLSVHDGSVFPTSLGANPQLSIYALAARNATALADEIGRRS